MREFTVEEKTVCGACGGAGRDNSPGWRDYLPVSSRPVCRECGGAGVVFVRVPLWEALDEIGLAHVLRHWIGAPGEGCGS